MSDPATGNTLTCEYKTMLMPAPIG